LVLHVWIPMIAMRDVVKLKMKLVTDLMIFKRDNKQQQQQQQGEEHKNRTNRGSHSKESNAPATATTSASQGATEGKMIFNSAKHLFISYRIASMNPSLPLSPLILQFSTPWPKRSYKVGSKDIRGSYQTSSSFIFQAATRISIYVLRSLIILPPNLQESILHLLSTSALGYSMLWFVMLYRLSPLYVIVPLLAVAITLHFYFYSKSQSSKIKKREIFPEIEKRICHAGPAPAPAAPGGGAPEEGTGSRPVSSENDAHASFAPSPLGMGSQLTSRKASMAQGEALGLQMIHQLRQQQLLEAHSEEEKDLSPWGSEGEEEDDDLSEGGASDDVSSSSAVSSSSDSSSLSDFIRIVDSSQPPLAPPPPLPDSIIDSSRSSSTGEGEVEWLTSSSEDEELDREDEEYWSVGT
jgi:hypothetical protein